MYMVQNSRVQKANGEKSFPPSSKRQRRLPGYCVASQRHSENTQADISPAYVSICTRTYADTHLQHVFISTSNTSISCMFTDVFFPHLTMWLQDPMNVPCQ